MPRVVSLTNLVWVFLTNIPTLFSTVMRINCLPKFMAFNYPSSFIYSRPVILQHFPLYRTSDTGCPTKPVDAMPKHLRKTLNRPKLDCLSKEATKQLLESLRPRLILSGHTHYSCKMLHQFGNQSDSAVEWSVASFSWRNLANPGFLMLSISSTNYSMNKCYLPTELRLIQCYITGFLLIFFIFTYKKFNKINMSRKTSSFKDDNQIIIGPVFQPDDLAPSTGIGPALPSDVFKQKLNKDSEQVNNYKASTDFEEIDTIGPLLPGQEIREEWRHLKSGCSVDSNCMNNEKPKRDTWMTELLPKSSDFNSLKPRKFRQDISTHSLHDSSWFTTPNDDSKQQVTNSQTSQLTNDTVKYEQREGYDQKMAKIASECQGSKQKSSLLELHEKKLKRKLKKKHEKKSKKHKHKSKKHKKDRERSSSSSSSSSSPPNEPIRRPFDREKDLKLSRIDTAARKAIIEHSKKLTSRFSHGSQQYL
ncbi:unnamed protein product [Schistosoma turkestanicum]|nr:unnamed protein product [Schistosoma turkestanicum]